MKPLCVVIPSRTASNLVPCIAAVRQHEPDARIIVVDDGVDWDAYSIAARSLCVDIEVGKRPFVFSRNVNIGIRAAGDSDVVLLNDDALLESPGGFSLMAQAAEEHPGVGVIGAVTNVTGQSLQQRRPGGALRIVPHIAFVCVYIPRRTIEAIGVLDERYCLDYGVEDRDYCTACERAGLKIAVLDSCYVDHGKLISSFRGDPRTPKSFAQNYALYKAKWGIA